MHVLRRKVESLFSTFHQWLPGKIWKAIFKLFLFLERAEVPNGKVMDFARKCGYLRLSYHHSHIFLQRRPSKKAECDSTNLFARIISTKKPLVGNKFFSDDPISTFKCSLPGGAFRIDFEPFRSLVMSPTKPAFWEKKSWAPIYGIIWTKQARFTKTTFCAYQSRKWGFIYLGGNIIPSLTFLTAF